MQRDPHQAPCVRIDYELMAQIATRFAREAEAVRSARTQLAFCRDALRDGDWIGPGAQAFLAEMDGMVMPALGRLAEALEAAERGALQVRARLQFAERDASVVLAGQPAPASLDGRPVPIAPLPDLYATSQLASDTQVLPAQIDLAQPPNGGYAPIWLEPARLLVSISPPMSLSDRAFFWTQLQRTPLGAELVAMDPGLLDKLEIRILPDEGLRRIGLTRGRAGISFPARAGRYLVGVSRLNMSDPADVSVLAHELLHTFQREHATDPSRKTDFTQLAMEREAFLFQAGVEIALMGGRSAAVRAEAQPLLNDPAQARARILARDALNVYAAAPEGVGGRLEDLGFSERAIQSLYAEVGSR
ncbi:MAG: WXG100 family type VII secretion target [Thermoflexales bacterium]